MLSTTHSDTSDDMGPAVKLATDFFPICFPYTINVGRQLPTTLLVSLGINDQSVVSQSLCVKEHVVLLECTIYSV